MKDGSREVVTEWQERPQLLALAETAVHVWAARLDRSAADREHLWQLLSADEQARARRFYFDRDRNHYIGARGILRVLVGRYLQMPATAVAFTYGAHGKPELAPGLNPAKLSFNVSHAHGVGLFAFGWNRDIGVDVEPVRLLDDAEDVAKRFFSPAENAEFARVPAAQKGQAFFNCWTRKEAFIKAIGEGLSHPLDTFDVTLLPDEPARLLRVDGSETAASRWTLHTLTPYPNYVGAILAAGQDWQLCCYRWPD